jgi:ethanolamine ammonia-lyase large subunit
MYSATLGHQRHVFDDLKNLLAQAMPLRSGDLLAAITAPSTQVRVAAQFALADVTLQRFLQEPVVPYETDEVTRGVVTPIGRLVPLAG